MAYQWKLSVDKAGKPNGNIVTSQFRGAYCNLLVPKGIKGDPNSEAKYGLAMLFPKGEDFALIKGEVLRVAKEKWGEKAEDVLRKQQNSDKRIFKDAGEKSDVPGFEEGCVYLQAGNKNKPGLVGKKAGLDGSLIEITDEDAVWSGDYFVASIRPFAWEHPVGGKGVSLSLQHIQLVKKGERLGGGRSRPSDDFEASDDDDTDELDNGTSAPVSGKDPFA